MYDDPIVEEIRKIRHEYGAQFNHDLRAIYEDLKKKERESGLTFVRLEPNPPRRRTTSTPSN